MHLYRKIAESKSPIHAAVISSLLLAPAAYAQVIPFVDHYKTNVAANTSVETNAADALLSGFSTLWTTGTAWNTGAPTAIGARVMETSQRFVVRVTDHLTPAQAESAYFTDRRNQSYSATIGLGALADAYRTAAGATTTITTVASNADVAIYNDEGTGAPGQKGRPAQRALARNLGRPCAEDPDSADRVRGSPVGDLR
jgi:hypothetical protein